MARRQDHSRKELKQIIIDAAYKIVQEQGYDALTARKVASGVGYAPGTIYNLFKSMDALSLHLNLITMDNLYTILNETSSDNAKTEDALKDMAARYYNFSKQNKNHWLMLFQTSMPEDVDYPQWFSAAVAKIFEPLENIITPLYEDENSLKMAARGLWASMHGIIFLEATGKLPKTDPAKEEEVPNALDLVNFMITEFLKGKV